MRCLNNSMIIVVFDNQRACILIKGVTALFCCIRKLYKFQKGIYLIIFGKIR